MAYRVSWTRRSPVYRYNPQSPPQSTFRMHEYPVGIRQPACVFTVWAPSCMPLVHVTPLWATSLVARAGVTSVSCCLGDATLPHTVLCPLLLLADVSGYRLRNLSNKLNGFQCGARPAAALRLPIRAASGCGGTLSVAAADTTELAVSGRRHSPSRLASALRLDIITPLSGHPAFTTSHLKLS